MATKLVAQTATRISRGLLTKPNIQKLDRKENSSWSLKWRRRAKQHGLERWEQTQEHRANFRVGLNQVHLPDFVVALMRTPHLPPNQAQFRVPLDFTKLDIRDYLFHAYGVRIHGVRSMVKGWKIRPESRNPNPKVLIERIKLLKGKKKKKLSPRLIKEVAKLRHMLEQGTWYEKEVQKLMIVDLEKPFVWPPKPTEDELDEIVGPGLKDQREAEKKNEELQKRMRTAGLLKGDPGVLAQNRLRWSIQATRLLDGKATWGRRIIEQDDGKTTTHGSEKSTPANPSTASIPDRSVVEPKKIAAEPKTIQLLETKSKGDSKEPVWLQRKRGRWLSEGRENLKRTRLEYLQQAYKRKALGKRLS